MELGDRKKGLEYAEKALKIRREVLGEKHADTATSYNNVGNSYWELGDRKKGLEYKEKALEIRKEILGEKNAATARSYHNVGNSYWELREVEKAIDYIKRALDIYMAVLGNEHPTTQKTLELLNLLESFQDRQSSQCRKQTVFQRFFSKWKKLRK